MRVPTKPFLTFEIPLPVAIALRDLPKYLVIEPDSTLRIDMRLDHPACEIDVALDNPRPGRSFVLMIGHPGGPFVQRVRLAGRARIYFDPATPGTYVLLFANPDRLPIVLRLRARGVGRPIATVRRAAKRKAARGRPKSRAPRSARAPTARARRRRDPPSRAGTSA